MATKMRTLRAVVSLRTDDPNLTEKDLVRGIIGHLCKEDDTYMRYPAVNIGRIQDTVAVVSYGHSQANANRAAPNKITRISIKAASLARDISKLSAELAIRKD